jgi:hypothetical protein
MKKPAAQPSSTTIITTTVMSPDYSVFTEITATPITTPSIPDIGDQARCM